MLWFGLCCCFRVGLVYCFFWYLVYYIMLRLGMLMVGGLGWVGFMVSVGGCCVCGWLLCS